MGLHDREDEAEERNRRIEKRRETFSSSVNELLKPFSYFRKDNISWAGLVLLPEQHGNCQRTKESHLLLFLP